MVGGGSQLAFAAAALLEVSAADFGAWERSAALLAAIGGGNTAHIFSAELGLPLTAGSLHGLPIHRG
jgi:hypothetical protein